MYLSGMREISKVAGRVVDGLPPPSVLADMRRAAQDLEVTLSRVTSSLSATALAGIGDTVRSVQVPADTAEYFAALPAVSELAGVGEMMEGLRVSLDASKYLTALPSVSELAGVGEMMEGLRVSLDASKYLTALPPLTFLDGIGEMTRGLQLNLGTLSSPLVISSQLEYVEVADGQQPADGMSPLDEELWANLATLGTEFQDMYEGAWDALLYSRADAYRQSAHSARELLDRVLRRLAPESVFSDEEIKQQGASGRPTRRMRAAYILKRHTKDVAFVEAVATMLVRNHQSLAAVAHTGVATTTRLRGLLRGSEAALLILFGRRQT